MYAVDIGDHLAVQMREIEYEIAASRRPSVGA
jgi:hypothetical protein